MILKKLLMIFRLTHLGVRYEANCTIFVAHGCVATPWNGTTIPRRCALPYATKTAHSTPSN